MEVVAELRSGLAQPIRRFPPELALLMMEQMAQEEPDDPCGLQGTLTYVDADGGGRTLQSLQAIRGAVQQKVSQIRALRKWLGQFTPGTAAATGACPGYADWDRIKSKVMELRDRSQKGLQEARRMCREVLDGDTHKMYGNVWSLRRAQSAADP